MRFSSASINVQPVKDRPVRFSVACNFDPDLIPAVAPYPVYEVFGKLTTDFFGGGRPSFYLPDVDRPRLSRYVATAHAEGIEFNYLLNASSMNNVEFTTKGQRELRKLLDWLSEAGVDTITVANLFFLRLIKQRYPHFGVRVSSHRETDNARKARFWEDNGADCIVVSETTIHRELEVLRAMREAVRVDLSLIVNNWCRQDCAIASNHAVLLSNASRNEGRARMSLLYDDLLHDLHEGGLWESYVTTALRKVRAALGMSASVAHDPGARRPGSGGEAVPHLKRRELRGRAVAPDAVPCARPKPAGLVSVGNAGRRPCDVATDGCGSCEGARPRQPERRSRRRRSPGYGSTQ